MITRGDIDLAKRTIDRLNRLSHGSPKMVELLSEVLEDVRTRAFNEGFSKGSAAPHKGTETQEKRGT